LHVSRTSFHFSSHLLKMREETPVLTDAIILTFHFAHVQTMFPLYAVTVCWPQCRRCLLNSTISLISTSFAQCSMHLMGFQAIHSIHTTSIIKRRSLHGRHLLRIWTIRNQTPHHDSASLWAFYQHFCRFSCGIQPWIVSWSSCKLPIDESNMLIFAVTCLEYLTVDAQCGTRSLGTHRSNWQVWLQHCNLASITFTCSWYLSHLDTDLRHGVAAARLLASFRVMSRSTSRCWHPNDRT
jgi:hypothetical protein